MKPCKSLKSKEKDKVTRAAEGSKHKAQQVEIPQDFAVMEKYAKENVLRGRPNRSCREIKKML